MTDEMRLGGMGIAPGVLETIAIQAASAVDGVVFVDGGQGIAGLVGKTAGRGVEVRKAEGGLEVCLHVSLAYGKPLQAVGHQVQRAVASALEGMTDERVLSVDVFVDGVAFDQK